MKRSISLAADYVLNIFWKILVLGLILIILNVAALFVLNLPYIGLIGAILLLCFDVFFIFSYLFVMYKNLKEIKNV